MVLFPSGFGMASVLFLVILFVFYKIKKFHAQKKILRILMFLFLGYVVIGCIFLFRSPFGKLGDAYFPIKLDTKYLTEKIRSIRSAQDFVDMLVPENETIGKSAVESENEKSEKRIYQYYSSENSRVTITITLYDDKDFLKEKYLKEIAREKELKYLTKEKGLYQSDNGTNAFCIFPVGFDGSKFLWPFADSNGANFRAYFYFGNSYAVITELADTMRDLTMPRLLNNFTP